MMHSGKLRRLVASLSCMCCGMGIKASDAALMALCVRCHAVLRKNVINRSSFRKSRLSRSIIKFIINRIFSVINQSKKAIMHILFVDESGTPPPHNKASETHFFILGGIVILDSIWKKLAESLSAIKRQCKINGEIKWRYFAPEKPGAKPHSLSHLSIEQKEALRNWLYSVITAHKSIRLICVVVNVKKAYELTYVNNANDLYSLAYKQLTERFQYYVQDLERTVGQRIYGIIVCDHRAPRDDMRLRELHNRLMTNEYKGVTNYKNIIEGLFIAPSHLSVGIQFADMVAGAVFRAYNNKDTKFFNRIRDSFRTSEKGLIDGYGIVKIPLGDW